MRDRRSIVVNGALVVVVAAAVLALAGCWPYVASFYPFTTLQSGANTHRSGLDVDNGRASWVEADATERGPVKYIGSSGALSTIATQAIDAWTAIGGDSYTIPYPLVAYRTATGGVADGIHIVNPLTSHEETFMPTGSAVPDDFGNVWVAMQFGVGSTTELRTIDIRNGATNTYDVQAGSFREVRIHNGWLSWVKTFAPVKIKATPIVGSYWGGGTIEADPVGIGVTVERAFTAMNSGGSTAGLSWTEVDGAGRRRIYYKASASAETTEIAANEPSKEMGGFDGRFVTWFENYGKPNVRARAFSIEGIGMVPAGTLTSFTEFDPSRFAWDFNTLLWQQRGTSKLFLTRFVITPTRLTGVNRYDTLANLTRLPIELPPIAIDTSVGSLTRSDAIRAASDVAKTTPLPYSKEIIIAAGYDSASDDAIVAPGLSGAYGGAMLLVTHDKVPGETAEAIAYLRGLNGGAVNIHVIGGTAAVSKKCYQALAALRGTGTIDRIGGRTAFDTAALVAGRMKAVLASKGDTMPAEALILNGRDKRARLDGASIGPLSASKHMPVLFVRRTSVPRVTSTTLKKLGLTRRYIIGGPKSVSDSVRRRLKVAKSDRIYGRNAYGTSVAVLRWGIAKGWFMPDSYLLAGHLHEALGASTWWMQRLYNDLEVAPGPSVIPVVLCDPNRFSGEMDAYLVERAAAHDSPNALLIGGDYSVGPAVVRRLLEIDPDAYAIY